MDQKPVMLERWGAGDATVTTWTIFAEINSTLHRPEYPTDHLFQGITFGRCTHDSDFYIGYLTGVPYWISFCVLTRCGVARPGLARPGLARPGVALVEHQCIGL
ncbi:hypothetical protein GCM10027291_13980 [Telluribacter humicola]